MEPCVSTLFLYILSTYSTSALAAPLLSKLEKRKGGSGGGGGGGRGGSAIRAGSSAGGAGIAAGLPFWAYIVIFFGTILLIIIISMMIYYYGKWQSKKWEREWRKYRASEDKRVRQERERVYARKERVDASEHVKSLEELEREERELAAERRLWGVKMPSFLSRAANTTTATTKTEEPKDSSASINSRTALNLAKQEIGTVQYYNFASPSSSEESFDSLKPPKPAVSRSPSPVCGCSYHHDSGR